MINYIQKVSRIRLNVETILFCLLLMLEMFCGFGISPLYVISGLVLIFFASFSLFLLKNKDGEKGMFWLIFTWIFYHLFCAVCGLSFKSAYTCFQHIGILAVFTMLMNADSFKLRRTEIKSVFRIVHYLILSFLFVIALFFPSKGHDFEDFVYIGLTTLPFATDGWLKLIIPRFALLCAIWSFIAFKIGARSQSVGFLLFVIVALIFIVLGNRKKKAVKNFFLFYYAFLNIFPMIYSFLSLSQYRSTFEMFSENLTQARFFSGRDKLWLSVYNQMNDFFSWIFGLGFNETELIIEQKKMSLHNLYVTLLSEGGVILVLITGLLLNEIWKKLSSDPSSHSKLYMSFMVIFLYKQSFDISLVENNLCVAFGVWTVFGIAYIDAKHRIEVNCNYVGHP